MALVNRDRVLETSTTTGTGTYTLAGAVTGFQDFSVVGNGNTCHYAAWEVDGSGNPSGGWETGLGTYTASGTTLARTTIYASSNAGAAVNWSAGTRRIAVSPLSSKVPTLDAANTFTVGPQTITPAVAEKGLVISMNSSSSANAVEIQRSSGTTGVFVMDNACRAAFGTTSPSSGAILTVQSSSFFTTALRLQVANSTEFLLKAGGDGLISVDATGISGGRWVIQNDGKVGFGAPTPATRLHVAERSATTNAVVNVCTLGFNSTGSPAAGLGGGLVFTLESSTTEDTTAALLSWEWVVATHASRTARGKLIAYDTAARECIRIEASGSAPMVGFFGSAAVIQQAGTGEATGFTAGAGTTVTDQSTFTGNVGATAYRISDVVKALKNLGLLAS